MPPLVLTPVRRFTCGGPISAKYEIYRMNILNTNNTRKDALNKANITKLCCIRMCLGHPTHTALKSIGVSSPIKEAIQIEQNIVTFSSDEED